MTWGEVSMIPDVREWGEQVSLANASYVDGGEQKNGGSRVGKIVSVAAENGERAVGGNSAGSDLGYGEKIVERVWMRMGVTRAGRRVGREWGIENEERAGENPPILEIPSKIPTLSFTYPSLHPTTHPHLSLSPTYPPPLIHSFTPPTHPPIHSHTHPTPHLIHSTHLPTPLIHSQPTYPPHYPHSHATYQHPSTTPTHIHIHPHAISHRPPQTEKTPAPPLSPDGVQTTFTLADPVADPEADPAADPGYHAPCYDKTQYVNAYKTEAYPVPVYETVYKKKVVPTTLYKTLHKTQYQTVYHTEYVPKYVTETLYKTQYVPKYVTSTHYHTHFQTQVRYNTIYDTQYTPVYVTKTKVQYQTHYATQYAPNYVTVAKNKVIYKTYCPKPVYG
ncbi:hypothetical protein C7M84_019985 [Penaeus vannamei]|uniref:Uncharacterized protein n=1 Tax=Penaeus vannamei TaxID=6689 RepID=A0A3R7PX23_PENVA|nr:hypothetical protein C7M84_019985 [Penaeus vannamei]